MPEADDIFRQMMDAGRDAFGADWNDVERFAPAEFRKLAVLIEEIARNVALHEVDPVQGYSIETGKVLFEMQRNTSEGVLVAATPLTMVAAHKAMDAVLWALRHAFKGQIEALL